MAVFPNPATNSISLSSSVNAGIIEVSDINGRLVGSYTMNNNLVTIETQNYAPGVYIYNMFNEKKEIVHRGKFEVGK